jgi:hypothetical protein
MEDVIREFFSKKNIAVVGSFRSQEKPAYRILLMLKRKGYNVFPVNPSAIEVEGLKCYASVRDIPGQVDAADLVTPPEATVTVVDDCIFKGIKYVWMQPGAEHELAIQKCLSNGIKVLHGICLMTEAPGPK